MDSGTKYQTTEEDIHDLTMPFPYAKYDQPSPPPHNEWLALAGPPLRYVGIAESMCL